MGEKNGWRKALSVILSVVLVCTMTIMHSKETQAASGTPFATHGRLSYCSSGKQTGQKIYSL